MRSRTARRLAAAAAVVLAAGLLPAVTSTTSSAADPAFRPMTGFKPSGDKVRVSPERYAAVRVDLRQVRAELGAGRIAVPTPGGGSQEFTVERSDVLAPELAAAHPEIRTYTGQAVGDPTTTIALDVTQMGFHAAVRGANGQGAWYVDPAYDKSGTTTHLSFYGASTTRPEETFAEKQAPEVRRAAARGAARAPGNGTVVQKRYRLALTSDPSYADYFGSANVLAEKATLISRVNQIYGQDLAISLQLVNDTDKLNFDTAAKATEPDGPCGGEPCFRTSIYPEAPAGEDYGDLDFCGTEVLGRNRLVLGQVIGAANYDIGHIALGTDGGGVAYLGVVGGDYKGGGCTGLPEPKGDFFAIDYVAHEMGHQFAGNHTFDGVQNACSGGNRNGSTSVEPGSGSSVMAYAGICRQDNLQDHTDPYFSFKTLDEVNSYTGAALAPAVEVQTVSLSGFGGPGSGSGFSLSFGDTSPVAFTPDTYTRAALETAVETATGRNVTIAPWGYDPVGDPEAYPAPIGDLGPTGFQVIFASSPAPDAPGDHEDVAALTVTGTGGVTTLVGETARGGPVDNGGTTTAETADHAPTVDKIVSARTLPIRTPFRLTGKGADVDGDDLTYLWEQADIGLNGAGTSLVNNKKTYGPLFRVFGTAADVDDDGTLETPSPGINVANGDGTRFFPDLEQVLSGNTNARTGTCPTVAPIPPGSGNIPVDARIVECFSEFLPTKDYLGTRGLGSRIMHFRLTVRDGRGGVGYRNVRMRIDPRTGPFVVTSQGRAGQTTKPGARIPVRWDVKGTDELSKQVRLYLSTDGGKTWGRTLTFGTANDGYAVVTLPANVRSSKVRIIVKAATSYFYSVNAKNIVVR